MAVLILADQSDGRLWIERKLDIRPIVHNLWSNSTQNWRVSSLELYLAVLDIASTVTLNALPI
jgi:hypothetical protein